MRKLYDQRGAVILDLLLVLFAAGWIMPITATLLKMEYLSLDTDVPLQDELNILQLRHVLNTAMDMEIQQDALHFNWNGKETHLYLSHNMLIRSPGTVIYLTDVEEVQFEAAQNLVTLCYTKNNDTQVCRILAPVS